MFSKARIVPTAILTSALLCSLPLAAALKTKPSPPARSAAAKSHSKLSSQRAPTSAHHSGAPVSAHNRRHAQAQVVAKISKPKYRGQQSIAQERTIEIQQALIREHYLDGEATGQWDQATRDALTRYQGDNHWQTKILPDSRALIKLGLGPSQQNLLNPESAAIAVPLQIGLEKSAPGGSN
jgi:hypothetical protein